MKGQERTSFLPPLRVPPGISRPNFVLLAAAAVRCIHETCTQVRFAMDSAVEGGGFEPSVPLGGVEPVSPSAESCRIPGADGHTPGATALGLLPPFHLAASRPADLTLP